MNSFLPLKILTLNFYTFDDIIYFFNSNIWIYQIFACLVYCLVTRRYLPSKSPIQTSFLIKQMNFYFISEIIIYVLEIIYSTIRIDMFERFLHHLCSIFLFSATIYEPKIICVNYALPTFIHSIYWSLIRQNNFSSDMIYSILMLYNALLIVCSIIIIRGCHWKERVISIRIPLLATLLFNINIMSHFYGYNLNLSDLNVTKLTSSIVFSFAFSLPIYIYLVLNV